MFVGQTAAYSARMMRDHVFVLHKQRERTEREDDTNRGKRKQGFGCCADADLRPSPKNVVVTRHSSTASTT